VTVLALTLHGRLPSVRRDKCLDSRESVIVLTPFSLPGADALLCPMLGRFEEFLFGEIVETAPVHHVLRDGAGFLSVPGVALGRRIAVAD
jgi:hypothetical protein